MNQESVWRKEKVFVLIIASVDKRKTNICLRIQIFDRVSHLSIYGTILDYNQQQKQAAEQEVAASQVPAGIFKIFDW